MCWNSEERRVMSEESVGGRESKRREEGSVRG